MSDLGALVAAVLDRPGGVVPGPVLADWLGGHDRPAGARPPPPGWWAAVPAAVARGVFRYPAAPRARYLAWQPGAVRRPELLPHARDPACVVAPVRPAAARRAGVRCHCGAAGGRREFTGGAWRGTAVRPPAEDRRAEWEAAVRTYRAAAADPLPARVLPGGEDRPRPRPRSAPSMIRCWCRELRVGHAPGPCDGAPDSRRCGRCAAHCGCDPGPVVVPAPAGGPPSPGGRADSRCTPGGPGG